MSVTDDLAAFATSNPEASVKCEGGVVTISKPWGDLTLEFEDKETEAVLWEAVSQLRLPPRFSAIWHSDSRDLEVIYGFLAPSDDCIHRQFEFHYLGKRYLCEFAVGSDRLRLLAGAFKSTAPPSTTNHRNLGAIRGMLRALRRPTAPEPLKTLTLTSFYVRDLRLQEEHLVDFARHLNFYMGYFDRFSPLMLIHEGVLAQPAGTRALQYPHGPFPAAINAPQLDPYLLALLEGADRASEAFRQYLHYYQILEYAAFYYVRQDLHKAVRRILTSPELLTRVDDLTSQLLDILVDERLGEEQKMQSVCQQAVDTQLVWRQIEHRADFFSRATDFDGGYSAPALIKAGWTHDDFATAWIPKLPDTLRHIRNALIHSREQRHAHCIAPGMANRRLLRPWADLIRVIAEQIMIYEGA